jgi:hypothetical protein
MRLPYAIDEQYTMFSSFLDGTAPLLHIEKPFYETAAILDIAIHDWEKKHGRTNVRIQYIESDTCSKRIVTHGSSIKRILFDIPYSSGWTWKSYPKIVTSLRTS